MLLQIVMILSCHLKHLWEKLNNIAIFFYCEGCYCHYEVIYVQIIVSSIMMINDAENCQLISLLIQMDKDVGFV